VKPVERAWIGKGSRVSEQSDRAAVGDGEGVETPPRSLRAKSDEQGISTGQAAAVISAGTGMAVVAGDVSRALVDLGYERYWSQWYLTPGMVDEAAGRIMQRRALWWQKRMVRGDVLAEVEGIVEGRSVVLSVPMWRDDSKPLQERTMEPFAEFATYEWPTGTKTGVMRLVEAEPGQRPRYRYTRTRADGGEE
jgi:hypothetical protein